jgi:hypothetical protein
MRSKWIVFAAIVVAGCAQGARGAPDGGGNVFDAPASDGAMTSGPDSGVHDAAAIDAKVGPDAPPDATPCIPAPDGIERCNGIDDNCNGQIDEGFPGVGNPCNVGVGACARSGSTVCTPDGTSTQCSVMPGAPGPELCGNGLDDNCNGLVDEGFGMLGTACSAGVGACVRTGTYVCSADMLSTTCNAMPGMPGAMELCGNGIDDNCNGMTDEGFPTLGMMCSAGVGACLRNGSIVCGPGGVGTECNASPGMPTTEMCNGIDDNCNGMTDEGFMLGVACDGPDTDLCNEGVFVCNGSGGASCNDTTGNNVELCNGIDDDCNPATADGSADPMIGLGCDGPDGDLCVEGTYYCAGGAIQCSDMTGTTSEICNGSDDDCDGTVDEDWPLKGTGCSSGVGACATSGVYVCNGAGTGVMCNAVAGSPGVEVCGDGIDGDCNGSDPACPVNDFPSGAINISAGGTFSMTGIQYAHDDYAPPAGCGIAGGRDVYYTFTSPQTQVVYFDTFSSDYDTTLHLENGPCTALGAEVTCNDDACGGAGSNFQSQLAAQVNAGGTYCLVVDQFAASTSTGSLTLHVIFGNRTGTFVSTGTNTNAGTTAGGSDVSQPSCGLASGAPDVGYYFLTCPTDVRSVSATLCTGTSYDSELYIRQGSATTGTTLACNDDSCSVQSSLSAVSVTGAGLWWIIVDGFGANSGAYSLMTTI